MKRSIVIGLSAAFVTLAAASAEARGRPSHHHRPHHRGHVSFSFGCWPSYRSSYFGVGYSRRGWSVGLSCWPSYRSYHYVPTYPVVYSSAYTYRTYPSIYSSAYTYPTYVTSYPATTATYPTTYTSYRVPDPPPPPPQPQTVQGWYHPTYGFWCQCHGYQKASLAGHSYQYDTSKDAKP